MPVQEKPIRLEDLEEAIRQLPVEQLLDLLKFVSFQVSEAVSGELNLSTKEKILGYDASEIEEEEWLKAASKNPVFDFLHDEDDIFTLADGRLFRDEG